VSYSGRVAKSYEKQRAAKASAQHKASMQNLMARNMATQQAAINLARMANKEQDINFGEGKLDVLLLTLTVRLLCAPLALCSIIGANSLETGRSRQRCHHYR
jgi:hypothetical protein